MKVEGEFKIKFICDNCKKGILLEIKGPTKVGEINFEWTCNYCKKNNKSQMEGVVSI